MENQQQIWFENLSKRRENTAITLANDFAVGNIWNSVIEKYSDQAHFIYELLQNADDSEATKSEFRLTKDGLYFTHNGRNHFWVSNPEAEKQDQENNQLGDINSITAVAQSNKKNQSTIGKYGVGFKAVFQYTETPHIYCKNFQFKIDSFIVPRKLDNDLPERKKEETIFYFPFDKEDMPSDRAYSDILDKLKLLVYPTLFLSNLQEVTWKTDTQSGEYLKENNSLNSSDDIICEEIELTQLVNDDILNEKLLLFSRKFGNYKYSIGYFLDENDRLTLKQLPAFCFFPTKETTNLSFIIHAPFLLTDSREGIHRSKEHNTKIIKLLAHLASDSLMELKELNLINDGIIEIIPYKNIEYGNEGFFNEFYKKIKEKIQTEEILPSYEKYFARKENAYWAISPDITTLFSNKQLQYNQKELKILKFRNS